MALKEAMIKEAGGETQSSSDGLSTRLFITSQKAFEISKTYLDHYKPTILRRYNMYHSRHCEEEKYNEEDSVRNDHYVPKSHEFVKNSVAQFVQAFFLNEELAYLNEKTSDDIIAVVAAKYFNYVMNDRLQEDGNWFNFIQQTAQSGLINNLCMAKVDWDTEEKKTVLIPITIENLRVDPQSNPLKPLETSSFIIYRMEMYVDEIKEKQETAGWLPVDIKDLQSNFVNSESETEEYEAARNINGYSPEKGQNALNPELQKVYVHENIIRDRNKYYVFYTLGTTKMLTKVMKLNDIYKQGIPFVMNSLYPEEMKLYSSAPLDHAYPAQRLINKFTNISMDASEMNVYPVRFVRANSGIDIKKALKMGPNSIVEGRNAQDYVELPRSNNPQSLKAELPFLMNNFDSTVGGLQNSTLATEGGDNTATSQSMRGKLGSQVISMYLMNFTRFAEAVLRKMLICEKAYGLADEEFVARTLKNTGVLKQYRKELITAGYNPDDFEVTEEFADAELKLSVNVGMGAVTPQLRLESLLASITAIGNIPPNLNEQLDIEELRSEIFSLNGYKDGSRFFKQGVSAEVQQLQAQLQESQAQNQELSQKRTPEEIQLDIQLKQIALQKEMKELEVKDLEKQKIQEELIGIRVRNQRDAIEGAKELAIYPEASIAADKLMENAGAVDPTPQDPYF